LEQAKRKLKRIGPVLKAKNAEMEKEAAELYSIRTEKKRREKDLSNITDSYMNGVNQLNQVRKSGSFSQLNFLEQTVDFLKRKWDMSFNSVKEFEILERNQLTLVTLAQQNLKAVEKLEEKYRINLSKLRSKEEQKMQDDQSIERRFLTRNRT